MFKIFVQFPRNSSWLQTLKTNENRSLKKAIMYSYETLFKVTQGVYTKVIYNIANVKILIILQFFYKCTVFP